MRLILLSIFLSLLTGCVGSKHTAKQSVNKDSLAVVQIKSDLAEVQKERDFFQRKVEELEYLAITFAECPPAINADSLLKYGCDTSYVDRLKNELDKTQATVERMADGSLKVQGQLKSVTLSKKRIEDSLHARDAEIIRLKSELTIAKTQVKTEIKTVEKEIEKRGAKWLWFIFGLTVGAGLMFGILKWTGKV